MIKKCYVAVYLLCLCFSYNAKGKGTKTIEMFLYEVPGLIWFENGKLNGPSYDALDLYFKTLGFNPIYSIQPASRAFQSTAQTKNSCIFPAEEYTRKSSNLDYLFFAAAVPAIIYAMTPQKKTAEELRGAYAVSSRSYLYHKTLRTMRINTVLVDDIKTAMKMIQVKRADYLLLSEFVALSLKKTQNIHLHPVLQIDNARSWLACNSDSHLPDKPALLEHFKQMVVSDAFKNIYAKYGMEQIYQYQYHPEHGRWSQAMASFETP